MKKARAKFFIFIIVSFIATFAKAESSRVIFEVIGGGLTYHLVAGPSANYSNKLNDDGRLIANLLVGAGLSYVSQNSIYVTGRYFKGNNSIGKPINGGTLSAGIAYKYLDIGCIGGGYVQNNDDFNNSGVIPFSVTPGTNAIVPIIGFEINPKLLLGETFFLKLNNIITPLLTNHTLSLGINF